jgi:thiol-disulfide isomerase/thioredoxin
MKQKVLQSMDSCLQPFEQLNTQHKISKAFYAHAKSTIKNYYASVLASILFTPLRKMVFHKDSAGYDVAKLNALEDQWREVLAIADIMDPVAMSTTTYLNYFYFYNNYYLSAFLYKKNGNQVIKGQDNTDVPYLSVKKYITKEPLREYWMAVSLNLYLFEKHYQEFIPGFYNEFVKLYPRSKYTRYLTAGVEEVKRFNNTSKKEFTAEHHFVQQADSISSVEELITRFKGKTIYIDMWATWCGPCKSQFAYKAELDPFLKSKGVEVLYVSLDRPGEEDQWKTMIKFYNLEGHHIRASEKLTNDIYKVFSNGRGISIPRYAICKDGKIIIDKAKQPGDKAELYKQIESIL